MASLGGLLVDRVGEHDQEDEDDVKVVGFVHALVDLCQEFAEDVGAGLLVDVLALVVLGLLLLRVEVDVGLVEGAPHVGLLQGPVVPKAFNVGHEIAETVDAVGGNVLGVTVAVVDLFLSGRRGTCLGRPLRLAYSERGFMTCPGAFMRECLRGHCA